MVEMSDKTVTRKSTLLLLRQIVSFELLLFFLFFAINFYFDYEGLEDKSPINYLLTIDAAILVVLLLIGLLVLGFIFTRWFFDTIEIDAQFLKYRSNVFLKSRQIEFKDIQSVGLEQNFFDTIFDSGTILIRLKSGDETRLKDVNNASNYLHTIRQSMNKNKRKVPKPLNIENLVSRGEGRNIEFKSAFRWDNKLKKVNKEIESAIMKAVCGFMNASGGVLLIGVGDDRNIIGLENDYKSLKRFGRDYFEVKFYQIFNQLIGKEHIFLIDLSFHEIDGKDICAVSVLPSDEAVYMKQNDRDVFYVRVGNTTQPLSMKETEKYIRTHWKL